MRSGICTLNVTRDEFAALERRVYALEQMLDPQQRREAVLLEKALFVAAVADAAGQLLEALTDAPPET